MLQVCCVLTHLSCRITVASLAFLAYAEVDTAHFLGNFPESTEILGTVHSSPTVPTSDAQWTTLLPRTKLGPDVDTSSPSLTATPPPSRM